MIHPSVHHRWNVLLQYFSMILNELLPYQPIKMHLTSEIYIAAPKEYQTQLSQFLSEYGNSDTTSVEFIWVDEMIGSADGLRAVNERIRCITTTIQSHRHYSFCGIIVFCFFHSIFSSFPSTAFFRAPSAHLIELSWHCLHSIASTFLLRGSTSFPLCFLAYFFANTCPLSAFSQFCSSDHFYRGDFLCMGSDTLCQYSFGELANLHRSRASDLTMLLVSAPTEEAEKKGEGSALIKLHSKMRWKIWYYYESCQWCWIIYHKPNNNDNYCHHATVMFLMFFFSLNISYQVPPRRFGSTRKTKSL